MDKFKQILKTQYDVVFTGITEVYGGSSGMNSHYKVTADTGTFFLKVYDKAKIQTAQWTENIDTYIPILVWLNENTDLRGRIIRPHKTINGENRFEDDENVYLLFDYVEGDTAGKTLSQLQLIEAAEILACLHNVGNSIPFDMNRIKEDFAVPFCFLLEKFMANKYETAPEYIKTALTPYLDKINEKNEKVKALSEKIREKNYTMTLCHMDAHGYNLIQGERLVLVDWEMAKYAPPELDLILFTKPEYWSVFIEHYNKLRTDFVLDKELLSFYIHRRNIEDIWEFINSIVNDKQTNEQRQLELDLLSGCCKSLDDDYFAL